MLGAEENSVDISLFIIVVFGWCHSDLADLPCMELNGSCVRVVMSANERTETVFECIRGGAEDYLLKPVTKKEVQHMWQHVWRRQQQSALRVPHLCPEEVSLTASQSVVTISWPQMLTEGMVLSHACRLFGQLAIALVDM